MGLDATIFGLPVEVGPRLPLDVPDDGENARRIVRHRMRELAPWIRFDVGPEPGKALHAILTTGGVLYVSWATFEHLERSAWPDPTTGLLDLHPEGKPTVARIHAARTEWLYHQQTRPVDIWSTREDLT